MTLLMLLAAFWPLILIAAVLVTIVLCIACYIYVIVRDELAYRKWRNGNGK